MEEGQASEQPFDVNAAALAIADKMFPQEEAPPQEPQEAQAETQEVTEEADPEEPKAPETPAEIRKHKLRIKAEGGSDVEVEVDDNELKSGYMRQADYQRKTQEVAAQKAAIQEEVKAKISPALQQYEQQLGFYERALWQALAPEIQNVDWNKLAKENPAEFVAKRQAVDSVSNVLQSVRAEQAKIAQHKQAEMQQAMQQNVQKAVEVLQTEIPGWNNDLYGSILKTGIEYGFKAEEVNSITDPRAIKVMHDAMKYRALMASKPAVDKKVANVPKVLKPGTANKPDQTSEEKGKLLQRLKKTGSQDDAIAFAMNLV